MFQAGTLVEAPQLAEDLTRLFTLAARSVSRRVRRFGLKLTRPVEVWFAHLTDEGSDGYKLGQKEVMQNCLAGSDFPYREAAPLLDMETQSVVLDCAAKLARLASAKLPYYSPGACGVPEVGHGR